MRKITFSYWWLLAILFIWESPLSAILLLPDSWRPFVYYLPLVLAPVVIVSMFLLSSSIRSIYKQAGIKPKDAPSLGFDAGVMRVTYLAVYFLSRLGGVLLIASSIISSSFWVDLAVMIWGGIYYYGWLLFVRQHREEGGAPEIYTRYLEIILVIAGMELLFYILNFIALF